MRANFDHYQLGINSNNGLTHEMQGTECHSSNLSHLFHVGPQRTCGDETIMPPCQERSLKQVNIHLRCLRLFIDLIACES